MNSKILQATTSFATLAENIVASGFVPEDEWSQVAATAQENSEALAELLTANGLLTPFQMTALSEGRGASLRISSYDILDRLGAGGMGTVYKARHRRMKRMVALKVLAANLCNNPVFLKRFQREVETVACLGHPNVVMAYDADEADVVLDPVRKLGVIAIFEKAFPASVVGPLLAALF